MNQTIRVTDIVILFSYVDGVLVIIEAVMFMILTVYFDGVLVIIEVAS